jgi:adenylate cyclase
MKLFRTIRTGLSVMQRYHYKWVASIAFSWTAIDVLYWVRYMHLPIVMRDDSTFILLNGEAVILRAVIVFIMSCLMGYWLVFNLKQSLRHYPLVLNLLIKTALLLVAAFFMNFLLHITYSMFILDVGLLDGIHNFYRDASFLWVLNHSVGWLALFIITQVLIEINEKYSPGVFIDILLGRYIQPRVETRIVMFLDLVDSTPIAEKLSNKDYFRFLRDFIYYTTLAILEFDGRIYQYVGDQVVVSWKYNKKNAHKCIHAVLNARRQLQRYNYYFRRHYGVIPEFKAGIHVGEVTLGEIGVIKKDIAMSGDTMNTTARIQQTCSELNFTVIISKDFADGLTTSWQIQSLGNIDLKGKANSIELFALMI